MKTMRRREFLKALGAGAAGMLAAPLARTVPASAAEGKRLNFVFILIDDMGWTDAACLGSKFYDTPNIDRLAAGGMRFTDGYAACTVCSPTRASIVAGKYPARLHLTDFIPGRVLPHAKLRIPDWNKKMEPSEVTIAEVLKSAGYVTAAMGKWHLGPSEEYWPRAQGFDVNVGGCQAGAPKSYFSPYNFPTMENGPKGEYLTDRLADEAVKFLQATKDKPFFLYLAHYAVHTPLQAKNELIEKYKGRIRPELKQNNATYGAMVDSVDQCVGRVLDALEELGIADRTVIFFTGDNGGLLRSTDNSPLRAGKGSAYEGGVREPFLIKWPGAVKAGSVCSEPVISVDFYPTILEMADVKGDSRHHLDGQSLVPLLKQAAAKLNRQAIYWHYPHYHAGGATPYGAVRAGDWRLVEFYEDMRVELYNLRDDIGETNDLSKKMPGKAGELRKMLHEWRQSVDAQMPTPNPDYNPAQESKRVLDDGKSPAKPQPGKKKKP